MAVHERPKDRCINPRQAAVIGIFASLAVVVLIVVSVQHVLEYTKSANQKSLVVAAVLASQAISCLLLIAPILRDLRSIETCRAGCVAQSLTGLSLVVVSLQRGSSTDLLIAGVLVFVFSCISLMTSFWPAAGIFTTREYRSMVTFEEFAPFLTLNANNRENSRDMENGNGAGGSGGQYRLLPDDVDSQASTASVQNLGNHESEDNDSTTAPYNATITNSRIRGTRRLLQLAAPEVLYLYAGCAVLLIRLPFSLSIPHFVSTTLSACAKADFGRARHEVLWLFLAGTIDAILDFWCIFLFGYANIRIVRGVRLDLFTKVIRNEVAFFDQTSSGELSSRLNNDCSEMAGDLTWFFRFSIESVVRITGITTYMLIRCPLLGGCALCIVPVVAVINKLYGDWLRVNATKVQDALAEANAVAQEAVANVRTVIAFAAEDWECYRYKTKIDKQYQLNIRQLFIQGVYYMAVSTLLINTVVQGTLLLIGSYLIERDRLSAEVLLAFMLYQGQLQNETLNLFQSYSSLIKSSGAGDKVFALLDRAPPAPSINNPRVLAEHLVEEHEAQQTRQYNIELRGVTFRYPTRPEHAVLDNLNLKIPMGKTVALVGASGCGKTTIVNLLQRFYDPDAGKILIDGIDLRILDIWQHRKRIGVVTQDPTLFAGTLLENITYGVPDSTPFEEVVRSARVANADGFIQRLPDGYNTEVGERGVQLSGGQKQRVSIARALMMKPSLLLLDEATSALDSASEQAVQEALDHLLDENQLITTVIIAHRLRTVRNADIIAVIHEGRVVEQGSHDELMSRNGMYREMIDQAGSSGKLPESFVTGSSE